MKKLLLIPTRYFPSISGAEFYFQRIAEILSKRYDYKVEIFTSNAIDFSALRNPEGKMIQKGEKYYEKVNNLKINRFPIEYNKTVSTKMQIIKNNPYYNLLDLSDRTLSSLIENGPFVESMLKFFSENTPQKYDLIHTTYYPYFNILISLILGKQMGVPAVLTPFFHFANPRYINHSLTEVLPKFDKIIACTHTEKKILVEKIKIDDQKVKVIPMGVDFNVFQEKSNKIDNTYKFKKKFFQKGEQRYKMVLFCGYKNYEKGAISILKAIPFIWESYEKVYFVFIGPPTMAFNRELSKINKRKRKRILNFTPDNLTGYFDKKKITAFREADIYLMPSRSDAFGIAFLEAWAASTPVIGANIGATPEVIQEEVDGLLVNFDDPEDIAMKVIKLLKSKRLRKKYAKKGLMKVKNKFTWQKIANRTNHLYEQVIKEHK